MMHPKRAALLVLLLTVGLNASCADMLTQAIGLFRDGQFERAIPILRTVIADPAAASQKPDALLLLAKSQMAIGRLDDAGRSLEYYIATYPSAPDYPEALYQRGRLLFLQEEYEQSIQSLQSFISAYPASPLVSSAWFWVGEDLYNLGHIDDAEKMYQKIVSDFPSSVKVEAARYKVSLIQLQKKELELERLLKWSHEEFLRSLEDYQKREITYEQAIEAYQKKLASGTASEQDQKTIADLKADLEKKTAEAQDLAAKLAQQSAEAAQAAPPVSAGPTPEDLQRREHLLALKEQALALKEKYLAALEAAEGAK